MKATTETLTKHRELLAAKTGLNFSETSATDREWLACFAKENEATLAERIAKLAAMGDLPAGQAFSENAVEFLTFPQRLVRTVRIPETEEAERTGGGNGASNFSKKVKSDDITTDQLNLLIRLTKEKLGKDLEAEGNEDDLAAFKAMKKADASPLISAMIKLPRFVALVTVAPAKAQPTQTTTVTIPQGIYAIMDDDEVKCYEVDHGQAGGRWEGFTFVKRVSSDDRWPVKVPAERERILEAIGQDVEAAGVLASQTLRRCRGVSAKGRKCRRTLTDTNNPYFPYGYGPECGPRCCGAIVTPAKATRAKKVATAITEPVEADGPVIVQEAKPTEGFAIPNRSIATGPVPTKAEKIMQALSGRGSATVEVAGDVTVLAGRVGDRDLKVTWNGTSFAYGPDSTLGGKRLRNVSELLRLIG